MNVIHIWFMVQFYNINSAKQTWVGTTHLPNTQTKPSKIKGNEEQFRS